MSTQTPSTALYLAAARPSRRPPGSPPVGTAFAGTSGPWTPTRLKVNAGPRWGPDRTAHSACPGSSAPHPKLKRGRRVPPRCRHGHWGGPSRPHSPTAPRRGTSLPSCPHTGRHGARRVPPSEPVWPGPQDRTQWQQVPDPHLWLPGLGVALGKGAVAPPARGTRPLRPRQGRGREAGPRAAPRHCGWLRPVGHQRAVLGSPRGGPPPPAPHAHPGGCAGDLVITRVPSVSGRPPGSGTLQQLI